MSHEQLCALVEKWDAKAIELSHHATMGLGWTACAKELSALLDAETPDPKLLAIAGVVNGYYNEDGPEALTAFRALRQIADVLGKPMEPVTACRFESRANVAWCGTHYAVLEHTNTSWRCPTTGTAIPFGVVLVAGTAPAQEPRPAERVVGSTLFIDGFPVGQEEPR